MKNKKALAIEKMLEYVIWIIVFLVLAFAVYFLMRFLSS